MDMVQFLLRFEGEGRFELNLNQGFADPCYLNLFWWIGADGPKDLADTCTPTGVVLGAAA